MRREQGNLADWNELNEWSRSYGDPSGQRFHQEDALVSALAETDHAAYRLQVALRTLSQLLPITGSGISLEAYAAIDAMADRLDMQVRKFKSKLTDHHRAEARHVSSEA